LEKEDAHGIRARYVGAPATSGVIAHCGEEKKTLDDGDTSGFTCMSAVSHSGRVALSMEQWECSENECHKTKKRHEQLVGRC
jgi:hypothetical protein